MEIGKIWNKLKEGIASVAEEIYGKEQLPKKQNWMNLEILRKMEVGRKCKNTKEEEQYKKLKHEIQKLCREAKDQCCKYLKYIYLKYYLKYFLSTYTYT